LSRAKGSLALEHDTSPLRRAVEYACRSEFYREKFQEAGISPNEIVQPEDLAALPFTTKDELRSFYPLKVKLPPEEEIVRIHSSSGTTGQPVLIPYTRRDLDIWTEMMVRCYKMAGMTVRDRVQITPGYGLWTAGIGFQAGVEALGAMAIPTGPGNTQRQLTLMRDLETTVLIGTSSYGLLLAEAAQEAGLLGKLKLKRAILGSERWGERMRQRIEELFGIETFDIYGLTEVYGPGIGIDCRLHQGIHYWSDYLIFEIIDPDTGEVLPEGSEGELVITTLAKEGLPLVRYRTRDITRIIPEPCPCGSPYPRIERIRGRSDDMIKIKGCNVFPAQIEQEIAKFPELVGEYRIVLERTEGRDQMIIELESTIQQENLAVSFALAVKQRTGMLPQVQLLSPGVLPRSEKKTKRVIDKRDLD
jgi:phenylacetate-CoA ligase